MSPDEFRTQLDFFVDTMNEAELDEDRDRQWEAAYPLDPGVDRTFATLTVLSFDGGLRQMYEVSKNISEDVVAKLDPALHAVDRTLTLIAGSLLLDLAEEVAREIDA